MTYTEQQIVEYLKALVKAVDRRKLSVADKLFVIELEKKIKGNESVDTLDNGHIDNLNKV